jgi:hypothetical protein
MWAAPTFSFVVHTRFESIVEETRASLLSDKVQKRDSNRVQDGNERTDHSQIKALFTDTLMSFEQKITYISNRCYVRQNCYASHTIVHSASHNQTLKC